MATKKPVLKLLGRSDATFPKKPSRDTLETFPNRNKTRPYWVTFECPEFTSLCPVTGQADFATISIQYIPAGLCIESKSLKFYLASYRSTPSFGEDVANRILDDLVAVLKPTEMKVVAEFAPRGGVSLTVEAEHQADPFEDIPF
ncbi:MAG: preQ(1) synthase [Terrimicrobiaceae bacterium]